MPIEDRVHVGGSRNVVMTECPYCGKELGEQTGWATHSVRCPGLGDGGGEAA